MMKHDVRSACDALAYITDCQLATVSSMAMKKSRPKNEYQRQISIATKCVEWCALYGCICKVGDRMFEARNMGVEQWAKQYEPR